MLDAVQLAFESFWVRDVGNDNEFQLIGLGREKLLECLNLFFFPYTQADAGAGCEGVLDDMGANEACGASDEGYGGGRHCWYGVLISTGNMKGGEGFGGLICCR